MTDRADISKNIERLEELMRGAAKKRQPRSSHMISLAQAHFLFEAPKKIRALIEERKHTIASLNAHIDELTTAGMEMERAKDDRIKVLEEALREAEGTIRDALEHFSRDADENGREALKRYKPARIHEAARVGR